MTAARWAPPPARGRRAAMRRKPAVRARLLPGSLVPDMMSATCGERSLGAPHGRTRPGTGAGPWGSLPRPGLRRLPGEAGGAPAGAPASGWAAACRPEHLLQPLARGVDVHQGRGPGELGVGGGEGVVDRLVL